MQIAKNQVKMEENAFNNLLGASCEGPKSIQTNDLSLKVGNSGHWSEKEKARYYAFL